MKVQSFIAPDGKKSWLVIGDDYKPIEAISIYLRFLTSLDRSPFTIKIRAFHLKFFWSFLTHYGIDWKAVKLEDLVDYIFWLKSAEPGTVPIEEVESTRSAKTINLMLTSVYSFYDFHQRNSGVPGFDGYAKRRLKDPKFKPFLHEIQKSKSTRRRILKLKEPKTFPGCLSSSDIKALVDNCSLIRDKFLLTLLYESGIRIGEAIGLRHEDLASSGENEIYIQPRTDNNNGSRVKNLRPRTIHVSKELMRLYSIYLVEEYPEEINCDYVFVNVKRDIGSPIKLSNVYTLFKNLQKKTGIKVYPHLFRHTHATELVRAGWDMAHIQKRLGHANVQTTANIYLHLSDQDMKEAYQSFLETKENNGSY